MIARLFELAWRLVPALPAPLARFLFALAADAAWAYRTKGAQQLERNLARVLGTRRRADLAAITRAGMRSYMRYYCDILRQRTMTPEQIAARVRLVGGEQLREDLDAGTTCVLALGHLGNWDLAGIWAGGHLAPVTTVAEHLKPERLFEEFCRLRAEAGIDIITLEDGPGTYARLVASVKKGGRRIVPLLADRDLSSGGVEVDFFGQPARMAPGPAALAVSCRVPLYPAAMHYERLRGQARRRAGSPWGIVVEICPRIDIPRRGSARARVQAATQAWADALASAIRRHPADWHMLQKVFTADLDPNKDRAIRSREPAS